MTAFGIYFGVGRFHMPLGYYTMPWLNQGPPSFILLRYDVIYQKFDFLAKVSDLIIGTTMGVINGYKSRT